MNISRSIEMQRVCWVPYRHYNHAFCSLIYGSLSKTTLLFSKFLKQSFVLYNKTFSSCSRFWVNTWMLYHSVVLRPIRCTSPLKDRITGVFYTAMYRRPRISTICLEPRDQMHFSDCKFTVHALTVGSTRRQREKHSKVSLLIIFNASL